MTEEFEGNLPEIEITGGRGIFYYFCIETDRMMTRPCLIQSEKCYNCLGRNPKFIRFYLFNDRCSCGRKIDFGYFMIIFCLERAGLLLKDFKIQCCKCKLEELNDTRKKG